MKPNSRRTRILILLAVAAGALITATARLQFTGSPALAALSSFTDTEMGVSLSVPNAWQPFKAHHTIAWGANDVRFPPLLLIERDDLMWLANQEAYTGSGSGGKSANDPVVTAAPQPLPTLTPVTDLAAQVAKELSDLSGYYDAATRQGIHVTYRMVGNSQAAVFAGLPNNGVPCVFIHVLHRSHLYMLEACGSATELSPDQEAAIRSLRFLD